MSAGSIIQMEQAIFRKMLVYTYTYASTVKREVEEQRGYMRIWRTERRGDDDIII